MRQLGPHAHGECPACTGYDVSVDGQAITDGSGYVQGQIVANVAAAAEVAEDWLSKHPQVRTGRIVVTRLRIEYADWPVPSLRQGALSAPLPHPRDGGCRGWPQPRGHHGLVMLAS